MQEISCSAKHATTLFGHVLIWNAMLLSFIWHHGYIINLLNIEKRINIIEKQFLWKGGRCRIHRLFLQKKLQHGGLNLLSLRNQYTKQIKQWMVDLYENKQQNCMMITRQLYERHSKLFFWPEVTRTKLNILYKGTRLDWNKSQ